MNYFQIVIENSGEILLDVKLTELFKLWERTSYELEKIQSNVITAEEEFHSLETRLGPVYFCNFELNKPLIMAGMNLNFIYCFILNKVKFPSYQGSFSIKQNIFKNHMI